MNFFRNASSNGTTIASRLVADEPLIPLLDDSAFTSAPLLSPNNAGTRLLVPAFSSALTPAPPPPKRPARLPSEFTSRFAPLISDSRPAAPSGVAPFWAMPPSTAGNSDVNADCVEPCDSPMNSPASLAKSPPSACWASASRFAAMSVPPRNVVVNEAAQCGHLVRPALLRRFCSDPRDRRQSRIADANAGVTSILDLLAGGAIALAAIDADRPPWHDVVRRQRGLPLAPVVARRHALQRADSLRPNYLRPMHSAHRPDTSDSMRRPPPRHAQAPERMGHRRTARTASSGNRRARGAGGAPGLPVCGTGLSGLAPADQVHDGEQYDRPPQRNEQPAEAEVVLVDRAGADKGRNQPSSQHRTDDTGGTRRAALRGPGPARAPFVLAYRSDTMGACSSCACCGTR